MPPLTPNMATAAAMLWAGGGAPPPGRQRSTKPEVEVPAKGVGEKYEGLVGENAAAEGGRGSLVPLGRRRPVRLTPCRLAARRIVSRIVVDGTTWLPARSPALNTFAIGAPDPPNPKGATGLDNGDGPGVEPLERRVGRESCWPILSIL